MPSLGEKLRSAYGAAKDFLWNVDEGTWISHTAQGFAVAAVFDARGYGGEPAFLALAYHGGARELPGISDAARDGDTVSLVDGIFDYACFFVGMGLYHLFFGAV